MSELFDHPDLRALDETTEENRRLEAEMAWDYTPSKPFQDLPGQTVNNPRDPATGEIQLPAGHPYIAQFVGETAAEAAMRVNKRPGSDA